LDIQGPIQFARLDDLVHQADAQGFFGADGFGADRQPKGLAQADGLKDIGRDHGRQQTQPELGKGKAGAVAGDGEITASDETHAAAVGRALNARDARLAQSVEGLQEQGEILALIAMRSRFRSGEGC